MPDSDDLDEFVLLIGHNFEIKAALNMIIVFHIFTAF